MKDKDEAFVQLFESSMNVALKTQIADMLDKGDFFIVYFSYPYSENPQERTEEIKLIVRTLLNKRHDIIPFIPHLAFDMLYDLPVGYSHEEMGVWEVVIISRCDVLCFIPSYVSAGVRWEKVIAKALGKPVVTVNQLREGWRP